MSAPQHRTPYQSVLETIGWTPPIRLGRVGRGSRYDLLQQLIGTR